MVDLRGRGREGEGGEKRGQNKKEGGKHRKYVINLL
jgi:hypothetical protein